MYDRLLFPTDGSDGATAALDHVLDIAAANDATVHLLTVADTRHDSVTRIGDEVIDALEIEGQNIVDDAAERAQERGVVTETAVLQGTPSATIVDYADERGIDLVAMPTHGRQGIERLLVGSVTERVVRRATVPVLTIRPDEERLRYPYRNVLAPTDGSECADAALDEAIEVATGTDAALHILSVVDVTSLGVDVRAEFQVDILEESANEIVEAATEAASASGVETVSETVEFGSSIGRAIVGYAEDHDVGLVVVGTHGRTGLNRYLLGSVAEKLIRTAPVPVLTVREPGIEAE
jgi:nucleotide-binding universal stress UspA family protein